MLNYFLRFFFVHKNHIIVRMVHKISFAAKKSGINEISPETLIVLSHAAEQRMRTVLERLTACSLHRNDPHKVYCQFKDF